MQALSLMATYCRVSVLNSMDSMLKPMRQRIAFFLATIAASSLFSLQVLGAENAAARDALSSQPAKPKIDRSGKKQVGEASIYADKFANKKMADGNRMDPNDDNAAHKTLPLGTKARVTNLETGQSTQVTIQDRGPFVKGRIIDLPPSKAKEIGLTLEEGVAKVKVEPIAVPMPDGSTKLVDGASDNSR